MIRALLTSVVLTLIATVCQALPEDRNKQIDISSDRARIDNLAGTVVYEGQVTLTQGTLKIHADRLVAYRNSNQDIDRIVAEGKPANYEQVPNLNDPLTKAFGHTIIYHALGDRLTLIRKAGLSQGGNLFTGNRIEYDIKAQKVVAQGDETAPKEDEDSRIHMVIQPKKTESNN